MTRPVNAEIWPGLRTGRSEAEMWSRRSTFDLGDGQMLVSLCLWPRSVVPMSTGVPPNPRPAKPGTTDTQSRRRLPYKGKRNPLTVALLTLRVAMTALSRVAAVNPGWFPRSSLGTPSATAIRGPAKGPSHAGLRSGHSRTGVPKRSLGTGAGIQPVFTASLRILFRAAATGA